MGQLFGDLGIVGAGEFAPAQLLNCHAHDGFAATADGVNALGVAVGGSVALICHVERHLFGVTNQMLVVGQHNIAIGEEAECAHLGAAFAHFGKADGLEYLLQIGNRVNAVVAHVR